MNIEKPNLRLLTRTGTTSHYQPGMRVAVVASLSLSLTNFRFDLLKAMVDAGHEVTAYAPEADRQVIDRLSGIGVHFVAIIMNRTGLNPLADTMTLWSLYRNFRKFRPDVVLAYTMKPVIYSGIAARMVGKTRHFALMTGLGTIFSDAESSVRRNIVRQLSITLYRTGLAKTERLFVYNPADEQDIRKYKMIDDFRRLVAVAGSGVNLEHFSHSEPEEGNITFLFVGRLLAEKGIREFVEAARQLKNRGDNSHFQILGPIDPNPDSISQEELDSWAKEGIVSYLGATRDVRPYIQSCSVLVLPTYYREGIPRTLLEGLAIGRALITTDMPGCRETVVEGRNGFLVRPRDPASLATAMERFANDPSLIRAFGIRSRAYAEERFDVHAVNQILLTNMQLA